MKLIKNFRSHETILHFSNDEFYGGELQACGPPAIINSFLESPILATIGFPILFHGIEGAEARQGSPSYFNNEEISLIAEYVELLRADDTRPLGPCTA